MKLDTFYKVISIPTPKGQLITRDVLDRINIYDKARRIEFDHAIKLHLVVNDASDVRLKITKCQMITELDDYIEYQFDCVKTYEVYKYRRLNGIYILYFLSEVYVVIEDESLLANNNRYREFAHMFNFFHMFDNYQIQFVDLSSSYIPTRKFDPFIFGLMNLFKDEQISLTYKIDKSYVNEEIITIIRHKLESNRLLLVFNKDTIYGYLPVQVCELSLPFNVTDDMFTYNSMSISDDDKSLFISNSEEVNTNLISLFSLRKANSDERVYIKDLTDYYEPIYEAIEECVKNVRPLDRDDQLNDEEIQYVDVEYFNEYDLLHMSFDKYQFTNVDKPSSLRVFYRSTQQPVVVFKESNKLMNMYKLIKGESVFTIGTISKRVSVIDQELFDAIKTKIYNDE